VELRGASFLVTGASRGIGRGLAALLAGAGARVTATARGEEGLRDLVREAGANVVAVAGDVGDDADARRMVEGAIAAHGAVDVLVNNAAVMVPPAPVVRVPAEAWAEILRVNVIGTANMVRHALPSMERRGRGVIVNLSSGWGRVGERDVAPYCASKFGVEALTQSLAEEVGKGIVVFALNPGVVDTDMLRSAWGEGAARYPKPEALAAKWKRLFERVEPSWNGRSLDLDDFRR
jgi:NAD(P)-dependent dehydrogenase (short-subunit alcohol dehydrogenase family)